LTIVGSSISRESLALRTFAARQRLPHQWIEVDSPAGQSLIASNHLSPADLPIVITPQQSLPCATPGTLAEYLGLSYRRASTDLVALIVIGSGPAGLATAVYGASEGLSTVVLDSIGIGGQAAGSSRIENYLGFPSGISGEDLTQRAALQAMKFGAEFSSPCKVTSVDIHGYQLAVTLADGTCIDCRAILIATGVRYKKLPIDQWDDFEGAGIYYAATDSKLAPVSARPSQLLEVRTRLARRRYTLLPTAVESPLLYAGPMRHTRCRPTC
jgi:thioredoxin reductase (NADPH)